ncbi:SH3 domain-containing protein [Cytophagaceae bacterium ABcell3]|nr:SH3 domain-containing protein [Cytophagaceae bacterium ABcell3]
MKNLYLTFFFVLFLIKQGIGQELYVTPENGLNLRSNASVGNNVVSKVPHGTKVEVLDNSNPEWYKVKYEDSEGFKVGYVSSQYLSEDKPRGSGRRKSSSRSSNRSSSNSNRNDSSSGSGNSGGGGSGDGDLGIGVRGGDPTGITAKKYFGDRAIEISIGRPAGWWYSDRYYHNRFRDYYYDYYNYNHHHHYSYYYDDIERHFSIALQVHYLIHKNLLEGEGIEGLQFYYGGGVQLRNWSYSYHYRRWVPYPYGGGRYVHERSRVNDVDLGVDFVIGLEYTIPDIPLSFFLDANLYTVLYRDIGFIGQFGIGGRFNF